MTFEALPLKPESWGSDRRVLANNISRETLLGDYAFLLNIPDKDWPKVRAGLLQVLQKFAQPLSIAHINQPDMIRFKVVSRALPWLKRQREFPSVFRNLQFGLPSNQSRGPMCFDYPLSASPSTANIVSDVVSLAAPVQKPIEPVRYHPENFPLLHDIIPLINKYNLVEIWQFFEVAKNFPNLWNNDPDKLVDLWNQYDSLRATLKEANYDTFSSFFSLWQEYKKEYSPTVLGFPEYIAHLGPNTLPIERDQIKRTSISLHALQNNILRITQDFINLTASLPENVRQNAYTDFARRLVATVLRCKLQEITALPDHITDYYNSEQTSALVDMPRVNKDSQLEYRKHQGALIKYGCDFILALDVLSDLKTIFENIFKAKVHRALAKKPHGSTPST